MELNENELERLYGETFHEIEPGTLIMGRVISLKDTGAVVDVGYKSEGFVPREEFTDEELAALNAGDEIEVYVQEISDAEGMVVLSRRKAVRIKAWEQIEQALREDSPVEGTIISKTKGGLFVDVNGVKAFLPGSHAGARSGEIDSLIGQKMLFKVLKTNSRHSTLVVSRRNFMDEERSRKKAETLKVLREGAIMAGVVKNITDYGAFIDLGGIDGLLHISDMSWGRISHPSELLSAGQEIEVIVLKFDPETEKVTLGFKQKMPDPWSNVDEKYPPGTKVTGKVVSITDYGAFVKVEEGLEGLVHVSEMDWAAKFKHPSKYVSVGDTVEALVLKADKQERRLSLSLKQLRPSPWQLVADNYKPGTVISGKVKSITDFGAFVGLPEGVDGLIHISDISWTRHIKHPSEVLKKGQKVEAVVLSVEPEKERIALGMKQIRQDPWIEEIPGSFHLGDELRCKVLRQTDFGIFVEMPGEVEGLIYASETARREEQPKEGDEVWARIIKIDLENRKIGLSMKNVKSATEE
jgi:small subunit ribosomal protein S1